MSSHLLRPISPLLSLVLTPLSSFLHFHSSISFHFSFFCPLCSCTFLSLLLLLWSDTHPLYQPGLLKCDPCIPQVTNDLLAVCAFSAVYVRVHLYEIRPLLCVWMYMCALLCALWKYVSLNALSSGITKASAELKADLWRKRDSFSKTGQKGRKYGLFDLKKKVSGESERESPPSCAVKIMK